MIHVYMPIIQKNPNPEVTSVTKVMLRVQVNNENSNPRDQGPPPSGTSAQAQSYHSQHPSNKLLHFPPPPQDMKRTNLIHETAVGQLFQSDMSVKEALKAVHTMSVSESIAKLEPNFVLKDKPPDIDKSESTLSRKVRSGLARLRSGYSHTLQSYLHRLDKSTPNVCPDCSAPTTPRLISSTVQPAQPTSAQEISGITLSNRPYFFGWNKRKKSKWSSH